MPVDDIALRERLQDVLDRLAACESRCRNILAGSAFGMLFMDDSGGLRYANAAARRMLGLEGEGGVAAEALRPVLEALPAGEAALSRDGETVWLQVAGSRSEWGGGRVWFVTLTDVTPRKRSEAELVKNQKRLELALGAAEMGSCDMDAASGAGIWSRQHFMILGYPPPEKGSAPASMDWWQELIVEEDRERVARELERARRDGTPIRSEHRVRRRDTGEVLWVNVMGRFLEDPAGQRFIGVIFDISQRRQAEEALRHSELGYRLLFETVPQGIVYQDAEGRVVSMNPAAEAIAGRSAAEIVGKRPEELEGQVLRPDRSPFPISERPSRRALQSGTTVPEVEMWVYNPREEAYRYLVVTAVPLFRPGETVPFQVYNMLHDVTEQKRAEEALRRSETTLKLAIEATGLGTFEYDPKSGAILWSDIARRHYRLPPDAEGSYATFMAQIHPEDRERVGGLVAKALQPDQGGGFGAVYRIQVAREERIISARGVTRFDDQGRAVSMVGTCIDVTDILKVEQSLQEETSRRLAAVEELQRQERLLIDQSRMAAMGEMLGNIAHQWRQPLNTLALIVQEMPRFYQGGLFSKRYLDQSVARAMQVISHLSQIIDGFRSFIHPDVERIPFAAAAEVDRAVALAEAAFDVLRNRIEVRADREAVILGYPNEYSQVILNILVNAKDAFVERRVAQPRVMIRLFREGERVVLTIADNAGGVPGEIIGRIFDPYFTTKGPTQGTGIGLFMSKTIVERHMKGELRVRNLDGGAEFRIEV